MIMTMYLTGQWIFKELVWRSFLQDIQINYRGNLSCKMHGLMHDLASSIMKHEVCILEDNKKLQIPKTLRHLSFVSESLWYVHDESIQKLPIDHSLRSMIMHDGIVLPAWIEGFQLLLSKQKYLRAFDGYNLYILKLPNNICKLEHLRYLIMACVRMTRLPESLTLLHNLQTLKLENSNRLVELPKGLKVMKNLWFLEMDDFSSLICTPPGLGNLTCLRSLSIFIVGEDGPHQIEQLKDLKLGGKLIITGLDNIRNLQDARSANLMTKPNLTCLSLSWKREDIKRKSAEHFDEVLEGLQPHQNIEEIFISCYHGSRFPDWMSTFVFRKLKQIRLEDCPGCEHLPPFGKLPSLTSLSLSRMASVKCLDAECYGDGETPFPALESLTISGSKSCPCLERLKIEMCPKLGGIPKLPTLKRLEIRESSTTILNSITFLTSLTELHIIRSAEVDVLPRGLLQNHKALESLKIHSSPIRTVSNVLDNLSALKTFAIKDCHNLEFLPEDFKYLSSLEHLEIRGCYDVRSFPTTLFEGLSSLRKLYIIDCKKLKTLLGPQEESPPALHDLYLGWLPELEYLPENVQLLTSLRTLTISDIDKLKALPDGFKDFKSLTKLDIHQCPELEKRCKKISHIPFIKINYDIIQHLE